MGLPLARNKPPNKTDSAPSFLPPPHVFIVFLSEGDSIAEAEADTLWRDKFTGLLCYRFTISLWVGMTSRPC